MKKNWLLVAGIVVGEVLSWTLNEAADYYWIFALAGAVAAMVLAAVLIHNTKKAGSKTAAS